MPAIYICYRKEDAFGEAAHLYKEFSQRFGKNGVFVDVARSEPGQDPRVVIDDHVARSGVFLVLIGKTWVEGRDAAGQRRLDNPLDPVRTEVAAALAHNIPIIPVLVQRAAMVLPADLPADMAGLANGRPIELTQAHWGSDVETLLDYLESHNLAPTKSEAGPDSIPSTAQARRNRGATIPGALAAANGRAAAREPARTGGPWRWMLAAALVVAVAVGAYITMAGRDKPVAVEPTVSDALGAAQTAVAKAEAARAEAEAAKAAAESAARSVAPPAAPSAPPVAREPSAADKAKAERQAVAIKAAEQEAQKRQAAKEEAEQAARLAREAKQKAAAEAAKAVALPKAAPDKPAPAAAPEPPAPDAAGAKSHSMKWTLRSSACGPTPVTVTGTARFTIDKTAEGIVVTENFRGSGGGVEAVATGRAVFSKEQPSYDIPTTVEWSGARNFRSTGVDRVNAANGTQPTGARLVKLQSDCG